MTADSSAWLESLFNGSNVVSYSMDRSSDSLFGVNSGMAIEALLVGLNSVEKKRRLQEVVDDSVARVARRIIEDGFKYCNAIYLV